MVDNLLVFMLEQVGTLTDSENGILTLEFGSSVLLQSVTQDDGIDLVAPSLAELIKAQRANAFYRTAAMKIAKAETETTISKEGVLVRVAHIDRALQKLVPHLLHNESFLYPTIPFIWSSTTATYVQYKAMRLFLAQQGP